MTINTLHFEQKIPATIPVIWDFISSPKNLKIITPPHMGFDIITKNLPDKMYPGIIISYYVKPIIGFKMLWVSEITQVKNQEYFVDEQKIGPYRLWHHQHHIQPIVRGVLMTDIVNYSPPYGLIGKIANKIFIKHQLDEIFDFRTKKLVELFGKYQIPEDEK
jgi:ligand-binding SRPBCC domain-containing protein